MDAHQPFVKCPVCKTSHVINGNTVNGNGICASTCESCGHFFKFRKVGPFKTDISFTVNGKQYTVGNDLDPWSSLNDFLRLKSVSTGTKIVCRQGGCGACIVVAKMALNPNHPPVTAALNSCLCPLFMIDGWEVTTTEGLGSARTGLHAIQKTLADFGGTQCGFCSPGHVMNMYGLMQQYPGLNKQQVEDHFEGNLCRCTGYRPILDAMKSLVPDQTPDIEDLSRKMCRTSGRLCSSQSGRCGGGCSTTGSKPQSIQMVFGTTRWYKAVDYADLLNLMQQSHGQTVRILGANTGTGYFSSENIENYDIVIDASGVAEFYVNTYDAPTKTFTLGAGVTLSDLMDIFEAQAAKSTDNGNFNELKKYLYRVASSPIRNRGTWAGNLMLKNKYPDFPSDIFNIFTVLNATITLGPGDQTMTVPQFFKANMAGKCIKQVSFREFGTSDVVACYKVMPRSQNSLALVNGAFRCTLDSVGTITGQPIISIGGISGAFHRANQTEQFLVGKQLSSQATLTGAMNILAAELAPSSGSLLPSVNYRKTVACSLLYKFFIRACGDNAGVRFRGAKDVLHDIRPLSSGTQTYDSNKMNWPVNEPVKKKEANIQCSGEALYTDDVADYPGQLYGAFVTSTQAKASIQNINSDAASKVPGVVRVLTAADISGTNDIKAPLGLSQELEPEPLFASGKVSYYGQAVAFVVAESQDIANHAANLVQVTYTNIEKPILTMDDAINAGSLFKKPVPDLVVGDPDQAMSDSPHVSAGTCYLGEQYHFTMETLSSNCKPTEDGGLSLTTATQWTDCIQSIVAKVTGLPESKVDVDVTRLGGSYGSKISRNNIPAGACALASFLLNKPVKMRMELQTNMEMIGKRWPYRADYKVGYDDTGKLKVVQIHVYSDVGFLPNEISLADSAKFIDNGYYCANWSLQFDACKTNKAMNTATRAPVSTPMVVIIEQVMERVAKDLNMDPTALRQANLYQEGQMTPIGKKLVNCNLSACMTEVMMTAQVDLRKQVIDYFNRDNRWKKKALSVVPMKFGLSYLFGNFSATVNVLADGTVTVNHGGVEVGQGINTKVAQVVAYKLGVPVSSVVIKKTNTIMDATNLTTGGSVTSEECCMAAINACDRINARIAPAKSKLPGASWEKVIDFCYKTNVLLSEKYTFNKPLVLPITPDETVVYYTYGAVCTEVELDVLTGEYQINRTDIVYDCGESLNPAVDVGQAEGAFVMGIGYNTSEELKYDLTSGKLLTNDTWGYHVPTNKDIPVDFRVNLLKNSPNPVGVLRSKASGEPPLLMSCSVLFALRKCIDLARAEIGQTDYFQLDNPATVEKVQTACMVDPKQFLLA